MPVVNYQQYCQMLDNAKQNEFAYPAINISSSETINAALLGFKEANSDGIIQVSTGGGKFASGQGIGSMSKGAIALAIYTHILAEDYDINVARSNTSQKSELPIPATYIVDQTGNVIYSFINIDYKKRINPEQLLQEIKDSDL